MNFLRQSSRNLPYYIQIYSRRHYYDATSRVVINDDEDSAAATDDNVDWRVGMPKLTRLTCQRGKTLKVVGLSALGPRNRPPPPRAARCPYLHALRQKIAAACNGHRRCYVSNRDLHLTRKQCPGVAAVFIDVSCKLPGGMTAVHDFRQKILKKFCSVGKRLL